MNDSKEHILLTSLQLFLQKSFKEVTMKDIVDKTGMSKGAFYHYFESKEQVFAEVINHFFLAAMTEDYNKFSRTSLKQFYTDILEQAGKNAAKLAKLLSKSNTDSQLTNSIYYLIFDAMKMMPEFRQNHAGQRKAELDAWKKASGIAIASGEIKTKLSEEQVARLFIYLDDGVNINMTMGNPNNELQLIWDSLYDALKA